MVDDQAPRADSSKIEVGEELGAKRPQIICHKCKQVILVDLMAWRYDISKVLRDNCPRCGVEIFMGCMLIGYTDMHQLMATINVMVQAVRDSGQRIASDSNITSPIKLIG